MHHYVVPTAVLHKVPPVVIPLKVGMHNAVALMHNRVPQTVATQYRVTPAIVMGSIGLNSIAVQGALICSPKEVQDAPSYITIAIQGAPQL